MKSPPMTPLRWVLVILCLVGFMGLGQWLEKVVTPAAPGVVAAVEKIPQSSADSSKDTPPRAETQAGESGTQSSSPNLFAVRTWEPPPPPPVAPPPPPPPQAPPLPYKFFGRLTSKEGVAQFMLTRDDRVITARLGDLLDDQYVLEKLEGSQLVFFYRPMHQRQTLSIGSPPWNTP